MSFGLGLFQHFAGRRNQRPNAPPPALENRAFQRSPGMALDPISGFAPSAFAQPPTAANPKPWLPPLNSEPARSPSPTMQIPSRNVHPDSTTAKGVPLYMQGSDAPRMAIRPVDVRHGGEQS